MTVPMATTEDAAAPDMALNMQVAKIATMPRPPFILPTMALAKLISLLAMLPGTQVTGCNEERQRQKDDGIQFCKAGWKDEISSIGLRNDQ